MLKSGLTPLCAGLLIVLCWLSTSTPIAAQTLATSPTLGVTMAKKSLFSFAGNRPTNLGVKDGKLTACPNTPNCVSSQAPDADKEHYIAAIAYSGSAAEAMAKLKSIVQGMERSEIINETNNYLYAEFSSALMGFVDDVEFYVDEAAQAIQVRSASRLGQSDLGVNRKRIEEIRTKMA
jgi:uncharacterized protein (DUF1499 family)